MEQGNCVHPSHLFASRVRGTATFLPLESREQSCFSILNSASCSASSTGTGLFAPIFATKKPYQCRSQEEGKPGRPRWPCYSRFHVGKTQLLTQGDWKLEKWTVASLQKHQVLALLCGGGLTHPLVNTGTQGEGPSFRPQANRCEKSLFTLVYAARTSYKL